MSSIDKPAAEKVLHNLLKEHNQTVFVENKVQHNQVALTTIINLYNNSKYEDQPDDDEGVVFFNIVNKDLDNANKKRDISEKALSLYIKDRALLYLLNAANAEFKDDYYMGEFLKAYKKDRNKYGTAVIKAKYIGKKDSTFEHIPWSSVICNPNRWDASPRGFQKEVRLQPILDNPLYDTSEFEGELENYENATVMSIELHGELPRYILTGNRKDKELVHMQLLYLYIPAELRKNQREGKYYVIDVTEEKSNPLFIDVMNKVNNRTMGKGEIEKSLDAQIVSNEMANLAIEELRAVAKVVRWSDDEELDGVDMGEIDNNTIINVTPGRTFGQIQANTVAFNEIQMYMRQWGIQNQDETGTQDVSLGKPGKSRTPFRSTQLQSDEVNSLHAQEVEEMALFLNRLYKEVLLNIVVDYFDTKKDITDLLFGEQLYQFYEFLADRLAQYQDDQAVVNLQQPSEDRQLLVNTILARIKDSDFKIVDLEKSWNKKNIIDKTRVLITGQKKDIDAKIATLTALHAQVAQNPSAYPNLDARELLDEIVALSDSDSITSLFRQTQKLPVNNQTQNAQVGVNTPS